MKAHMGPGALAVSGEWALSTDLMGLVHAYVHAKLLKLRLTLCDAMDCSPPGCSVRGISQARIMEWVAISFSRGSSRPRDKTQVSCTAQILYHLSLLKPAYGSVEGQQMSHCVTGYTHCLPLAHGKGWSACCSSWCCSVWLKELVIELFSYWVVILQIATIQSPPPLHEMKESSLVLKAILTFVKQFHVRLTMLKLIFHLSVLNS